MAHITGAKVLGREIFPGDVILNEWDGEILTVGLVEIQHNKSVKLHCRRDGDGAKRIIEGNWDGTTRLVTRTERQITADYTPEELALINTGELIEKRYPDQF